MHVPHAHLLIMTNILLQIHIKVVKMASIYHVFYWVKKKITQNINIGINIKEIDKRIDW